jgi:hypothetical protein
MTSSQPGFAQIQGLNPLDPTAPVGRGTGLVFKDVTIIIIVGLALGLVLLLAAKVILRRTKLHRHDRRVDSEPEVSGDGEESHRRHRRRRRRLRRDHRSRNPTLAETGGLPAPKVEEPLDPSL